MDPDTGRAKKQKLGRLGKGKGSALAERVNAVMQANPAVRKAVEALFHTKYFVVPVDNIKMLSSMPGSPPQVPHADDDELSELFVIVQLAHGQAPTLCEKLGTPLDGPGAATLEGSPGYASKLETKYGKLLRVRFALPFLRDRRAVLHVAKGPLELVGILGVSLQDVVQFGVVVVG